MKAFKTRIKPALIAALFVLDAGAATLSLEPATLTVGSGDNFSIDLVVSGLGNGIAPSLGDVEVEIGYDPAVLGWVGLSFAAALGDISTAEAIDVSFGESVPGTVNVAVVSLLSDVELELQQSDSFVLATLDFVAQNLGGGESTGIEIAGVESLGDQEGEPIAVDGATGVVVTATVTDADGDGVADDSDNCLDVANSNQRDTDGDNIGNLCDPDVNEPNDCMVNFDDLNVFKASFFQFGDLDTDLDGDGQTNFADLMIVKSFFFGVPGPSASGCN